MRTTKTLGIVGAALALVCVLGDPLPADELSLAEAAQLDLDSSGTISYEELYRYYIERDSTIQELRSSGASERFLSSIAEGWTVDAVSIYCSALPCSIPVTKDDGTPNADLAKDIAAPKTEASMSKSAAEEVARASRIGWKGLAFKRYVTDPIDPRRGWKTNRPVVFSYLRDRELEREEDSEEEVRRDQFSFLGGVQLYSKTWQPGELSFVSIAPGIEMDIDGSKPASETTLKGAVASSIQWVSSGGEGPVDEHTLTFAPAFLTDRDFNREAWELSMTWSFSSRPAAIGFFKYFGSDPERRSRFSWSPTLTLLTGKVIDAAGNDKLQLIEDLGRYERAELKVSVGFRPWGLSRVNFVLDHFLRHDFGEGWDRHYSEASLAWDANAAKSVQLTLVARKGRKPPDFQKVDQLLFGVSLLQD